MKIYFGALVISMSLLACNSADDSSNGKDYLALGKSISGETQKALGGELKAAIERGGIKEAVNYCNINAISITDSMAKLHNVTIKRVTDRPRNFVNEADQEEQGVIAVWNTKMMEKEELNPVHFVSEEKVDYYAPIMIQPLCLNCHGEFGSTLPDENYDFIAFKYPYDLAIGYKEGDLRGAWHITFEKSNGVEKPE